MSTITASPGNVPETVAARLRGLRMKLAMFLVVDGLAWVLLTLFAVCWLDLLLDWLIEFDVYQRAIMLFLMIAAVGAVAWWRLVRPFFSTIGDDALCLAVERRHRELGESLISAVQFHRLGEAGLHPGVSRTMVAATILHGTRAAEGIDFGDALNSQRMTRNLLLLALGAALVLGTAGGVAASPWMQTWFVRNILLMDRAWPKDTYLEAIGASEKNEIHIVRGDNHQQFFGVTRESKSIPDEIRVEFRAGHAREPQDLKRLEEPPADASFDRADAYAGFYSTTFEAVGEEFQFRAVGGDGATPWIQVRLIEPPRVESRKITVRPPGYTGEKPFDVPPHVSPLRVLEGSEIAVEATSSKALSAAYVDLDGRRFDAEVQEGRRAAIVLPREIVRLGKYTVSLVLLDQRGLSAAYPYSFTLDVYADEQPHIDARFVGIDKKVISRARLPVEGRMTDDYGITSIAAEYSWPASAAGDAGAGTIELLGFAELLRGRPEQIPLDTVAIDLEPIAPPAGVVLTIRLLATDSRELDLGETTLSANTAVWSDSILIVTEEDLRADLLNREQHLRGQIEQLLEFQQSLKTEIGALAADAKAKPDLDQEQLQALLETQRRQRALAGSLSVHAETLSRIVEEIRNNRLEEDGGPMQQRLMQTVILPMRTVANETVTEAVDQMDRARRLRAEAEGRDAALAETGAAQQRIIDALQEVLRQMKKSETYQEAINLLQRIEKAQENVRQKTEEELRAEEQRVLGGDDEEVEKKKP